MCRKPKPGKQSEPSPHSQEQLYLAREECLTMLAGITLHSWPQVSEWPSNLFPFWLHFSMFAFLVSKTTISPLHYILKHLTLGWWPFCIYIWAQRYNRTASLSVPPSNRPTGQHFIITASSNLWWMHCLCACHRPLLPVTSCCPWNETKRLAIASRSHQLLPASFLTICMTPAYWALVILASSCSCHRPFYLQFLQLERVATGPSSLLPF